MILRLVQASKNEWGFMWNHVKPPLATLLKEECHVSLKQVAILAAPHLPWRSWNFINDKDFVQLWAAAALAIPYTEEINQSICDTLMQLAASSSLRWHIPVGVWPLLNKRPSLPPICYGRYMSHPKAVRIIRALGDSEILTSYLLLAWSEWDWHYDDVHDEMVASIKEEFGGIGMWHNRELLLHRLDQVLEEFNLGLKHLQQRKPSLNVFQFLTAKEQHEKLRKILLKVDREAMRPFTREPLRPIILSGLLTPVDASRILLDVYVCAPSPVSMIALLSCSPPLPATRNSACRLIYPIAFRGVVA